MRHDQLGTAWVCIKRTLWSLAMMLHGIHWSRIYIVLNVTSMLQIWVSSMALQKIRFST